MGESGDTAAEASTPEAPAQEQLAAEPEKGSTGTQEPASDTETATAAADDLRSYIERRKAERPDLAEEIDRTYRDMQAAFTPKLQEAAELRKQFDGLDPEAAAFYRQVNEIALVDPAAAAALWRQAEQQLFGAPPPPENDPWQTPPEDLEFATETERVLYQRLQALEQRQQSQDAWKQQETATRNQALMQRQFDEIKQEFGQDVPQDQKEAAARFCLQNRLDASKIGMVWRGLYGTQAARQMGRNEAAGFVERKAAMTPGPSSIANPPPVEDDPSQGTLREVLERAGGMRR